MGRMGRMGLMGLIGLMGQMGFMRVREPDGEAQGTVASIVQMMTRASMRAKKDKNA